MFFTWTWSHVGCGILFGANWNVRWMIDIKLHRYYRNHLKFGLNSQYDWISNASSQRMKYETVWIYFKSTSYLIYLNNTVNSKVFAARHLSWINEILFKQNFVNLYTNFADIKQTLTFFLTAAFSKKTNTILCVKKRQRVSNFWRFVSYQTRLKNQNERRKKYKTKISPSISNAADLWCVVCGQRIRHHNSHTNPKNK